MGGTTRPFEVLHVDDELDFAAMTAEYLESQIETVSVETAPSAKDCLEKLTANKFDCVVIDYALPRMNGIELLETVREEHPDLPVILFTGKGSEELATESIRAGVSDYIPKTNDTEQFDLLAERILNAIDQSRGQANYREIFEKMPDGVTLHDATSGSLIDTNQQFCDMLGYTKDELLEMNFAEIHPDEEPYTAERAREHIQRAATEGPQTFEWRDQTKAGDLLPVEVHLRQTTINNEQRILAVVRDISERKERERRYSAIFNQTYQFTGLLELDGTLIEANQTALDFGGLDRDEVVGKKMWDAYWFQHSEETKERARKAVEQAAQGEFVRHELPVQGAEGEEVIIDFSVRPVTDEDEDVVLLVPEGRDITDLKRREDELRRERDRFQMAFDSVPEPVVHVKFNGTAPIVYRINEAFETTFGYSQEEAKGQSIDTLVVPKHRQEEAADINHKLLEGGRVEEEIVRQTTDGEKPFLFTAKTLPVGHEAPPSNLKRLRPTLTSRS